VRLLEPDFGELPEQNFDWCHSVYGNVEELLPKDAPKPLGKAVTTITYTDANLYHDMLTGRSVTGILHLCNQTLIDWYSKRQATVETATFGSDFTAARISVDQKSSIYEQHLDTLEFQFIIKVTCLETPRQW
jgi:hypothetical protein